MPGRTALRLVRRIAGACIAGAFVAGVVVSATQSPTSPRFAGEAPAPASALSLWYRAPASDHPLLPVSAPRESRQAATAEWVRALPVGNGRLGAMIFGGIVHERLQLNEDTLWAGRPYDPVNPEAKDALPEVRRLLAERNYAEAAKLAGAKVMSKPLAQMPYQTVGDLALTFPDLEAVEDYRRDLDLATATAHVSYTSRGVAFSREVFASAPAQVIVVRLSASRPGQISFTAGMQTPQRATVEATADGDLVMRGVNGDGAGATADGRAMTGALRFEARVRVLPTGGTRETRGDTVVIRDADTVTLLIAAATSYRTYEDVTADPAARVAAALDPAARESVDTLRAAHIRDYEQLFNRVTLEVGHSMQVPTDERVRAFGDGGDPGLAALYFQYGRYLLIASSRAGSQPANLQGFWNESMTPAVGQQVHHQYQHRDELLAGALDQPGRDDGSVDGAGVGPVGQRRANGARDVRGRWMDGAPQYRSVARDRADRRSRNMDCGRLAAHGSRCRYGTATNTAAIATIWRASIRCSKVRRSSSSTRWSRSRTTTGWSRRRRCRPRTRTPSAHR